MNYIPLEAIMIILSVLAGFLLGRFVKSEKTANGEMVIDIQNYKWHLRFDGDLIDLSRKDKLVLSVHNEQIKEDPTWRSES